jgi:hypothetical protein
MRFSVSPATWTGADQPFPSSYFGKRTLVLFAYCHGNVQFLELKKNETKL